MQNLRYKTQKGVEVELDVIDMQNISKHYLEQCTADYLRENHADWAEEKVQSIAVETRHLMDKYGFDEEVAISVAMQN